MTSWRHALVAIGGGADVPGAIGFWTPAWVSAANVFFFCGFLSSFGTCLRKRGRQRAVSHMQPLATALVTCQRGNR